jgi:hypothetical protein
MKKHFYVLLLFVAFFTKCDEPRKKNKSIESSSSENNAKTPVASKEAHQFFDWWLQQNNQIINLNDQFRAKLFYKRDVVELLKYLKRNGLNTSLFQGIQDTIDGLSYRKFNSNFIKATNVTWIDQDRLRACRKISKNAMWDCLSNDYGITDYYYVSLPLFSIDKRWAVVSINYMEVSGQRSNGANRLFKRTGSNSWEEVAVLTFWGNFKTN